MEGQSIKRITAICLVAAAGLAAAIVYHRSAVISHPPAVISLDSGKVVRLGTFVRIKLRCIQRQSGLQAQAAALQAIDRVDRLMSTYRDDSELSRVNRLASHQPVSVSRETFELLAKALDYSRTTGGAFDITVTPLLQLWKQAARQNRLPTPDELTRARQAVGYDKVLLCDGELPTVAFSQEGVRLNVDAIAKGYAVDQALQALRRPGITGALVDIGGDIACFGSNTTDREWTVGIQDPFTDSHDDPLAERPRWIVRLKDCAVATSGSYRQYVTISGRKYSHIVDPAHGPTC